MGWSVSGSVRGTRANPVQSTHKNIACGKLLGLDAAIIIACVGKSVRTISNLPCIGMQPRSRLQLLAIRPLYKMNRTSCIGEHK